MPRMGFHIPCDEVKLALVQDRPVVLQVKDEMPLGTGGVSHPIGGSEQAALWRHWTGNQGHRSARVSQEESACGVVLEEDQVARADSVDTTQGA